MIFAKNTAFLPRESLQLTSLHFLIFVQGKLHEVCLNSDVFNKSIAANSNLSKVRRPCNPERRYNDEEMCTDAHFSFLYKEIVLSTGKR